MSAKEGSLLVGIHPVAAALATAPDRLRALWIAEECRNPRVRELERCARDSGVAIERHARAELDRHSGRTRHQDVMAWFAGGNTFAEADIPRLLQAIDGPPLLLVLDGVQDPHNLGACLRSAEAAGAHFVVLPRDRAAGLTPVVRRAAAGAAETLQLVTVPNLARVLRQLKAAGVWLVGTAERADQSLYATDLRGPLALVMGGEGQGLRRLTAELCDFLVAIPMAGSVGSLNVSVATAICLFEAVRQRIGS
jgi:23S rRNA (guanosine2251-2'-O)-methyltransferase